MIIRVVRLPRFCSNQAMLRPAPTDSAELILEPDWLIPIEPTGVILERHAVVVGRGLILAVLPANEARRRFNGAKIRQLPGQVVMPGLINLHTHAAMNLLRGYADDLPLMRWLTERIWPAESRLASPDFVEAGTYLACAEMLRGGITCFNDMYFHPAAAARAVDKAGIRAMLGMIVIEFPTSYAGDASDYLAKGLAARDAWADHDRIGFCFAPHAPYTVSDKSFERVAVLAGQLNVPIHLHVHETIAEISESQQKHGCRPLMRLERLGIVGPQLLAVHAVHLTASELDLLAHSGASVAHCPTSNLKLAAGVAPIAEMDSRSINVGFGTDGAASNNRLDLFHEMRHASLLAKGLSGDATAMGAHRTLRAATLAGATALGMDDTIGSLIPGKAADMISIGLDEWDMQPCFDPASHIVYVAGREHVRNVWVGGKQVLQNGEFTGLNTSTLLETAQLWHNRVVS